MSDKLLSRFLRYVQIDTQSDETSNTFPSTPGQLVLLEMLKQELSEIGSSGRADDKARLRHGECPLQHAQSRRADRGLSRSRGHGSGLLRQRRQTDSSSQIQWQRHQVSG
jgi:hypothetical protein